MEITPEIEALARHFARCAYEYDKAVRTLQSLQRRQPRGSAERRAAHNLVCATEDAMDQAENRFYQAQGSTFLDHGNGEAVLREIGYHTLTALRG